MWMGVGGGTFTKSYPKNDERKMPVLRWEGRDFTSPLASHSFYTSAACLWALLGHRHVESGRILEGARKGEGTDVIRHQGALKYLQLGMDM